jgi:hypothetical protein
LNLGKSWVELASTQGLHEQPCTFGSQAARACHIW